MIDFKDTSLTNCIVHKVGNKNREEKINLSNSELILDDSFESSFQNYLLKPFKIMNEVYQFHHEIDLKMNEVFVCADNIFEEENFIQNSANIAKHLFEQTRHSAIKLGELFIAVFEDVIFDGIVCKAIGIFKSEIKDNFFKLIDGKSSINIEMDKGVNHQKLDKGCLILNNAYHEGYSVFAYENNNADTDYWRNDFLDIRPKENNYFQTKNFLNICKDYVTEKLPNEFEITKADQINLLNKSMDFFKNNKEFQSNKFINEVFEEPEIKKSFKKFKNEFQQSDELKLPDEFNISSEAVKKQNRNYKSVLKLDKNFHVYIHGNNDLIEKGYDAKLKKNYYKIYFDEEE